MGMEASKNTAAPERITALKEPKTEEHQANNGQQLRHEQAACNSQQLQHEQAASPGQQLQHQQPAYRGQHLQQHAQQPRKQ